MRYTRIEKYIASAADKIASVPNLGIADLQMFAKMAKRFIREELTAAGLYRPDGQVEAPVEEARAEFVRQVVVSMEAKGSTYPMDDSQAWDKVENVWARAEEVADEGVRRGLIGPLGAKKAEPIEIKVPPEEIDRALARIEKFSSEFPVLIAMLTSSKRGTDEPATE